MPQYATEISLIDIVPEYPTEDDPKLAAEVFALPEFRELEEPFGKAPNPFGDKPPTLLFNHQEIVIRYFSPISDKRRGLIMPDPGLGKTPIGVLLAEQGKSLDRKIMVFTQNAVMEANFKENIHKFTGGIYAAASTEETIAVQGIKISDFYEFKTYDSFSKTLLDSFDPHNNTFNPGFIEKYHGRRIIMDESHHIRATRQAAEGVSRTITDEALESVTGKGRASW